MKRGLVFYERSSDFIEYYSANDGHLAKLGELPGSGRQWTNIVAGTFYNTGYAGLLFYEARSGTGYFCLPFNDGRTFSPGFRNEHTGWRTTWTHVVCGNFGGPSSGGGGAADLLFYDPSTGTGEFYRVAEVVENGMLQIRLVLLRTHNSWRSSWTHVIPGQFGGDGLPDFLFYDASSGTGEFYATDNGRLELIQGYFTWRRSWDAIVPGDFAGSGRTSLLFYDAAGGIGEFYATDPGRIQLIGQAAGWRSSWSPIVAFDSDRRGGGGEL